MRNSLYTERRVDLISLSNAALLQYIREIRALTSQTMHEYPDDSETLKALSLYEEGLDDIIHRLELGIKQQQRQEQYQRYQMTRDMLNSTLADIARQILPDVASEVIPELDLNDLAHYRPRLKAASESLPGDTIDTAWGEMTVTMHPGGIVDGRLEEPRVVNRVAYRVMGKAHWLPEHGGWIYTHAISRQDIDDGRDVTAAAKQKAEAVIKSPLLKWAEDNMSLMNIAGNTRFRNRLAERQAELDEWFGRLVVLQAWLDRMKERIADGYAPTSTESEMLRGHHYLWKL